MKVLKVCPNPHCEAVFHNCDKKKTKCLNCDGNIIEINQKTYLKKFSDWFFQYDYETFEYYRPEKIKHQLQLEF
jgi:hypothetical protein